LDKLASVLKACDRFRDGEVAGREALAGADKADDVEIYI